MSQDHCGCKSVQNRTAGCGAIRFAQQPHLFVFRVYRRLKLEDGQQYSRKRELCGSEILLLTDVVFIDFGGGWEQRRNAFDLPLGHR